MTDDELKNLQPGDIVQNIGSGEGCIVIANDNGHITAIRVHNIMNAPEWKLIQSAKIVILSSPADQAPYKKLKP